MPDKLPASDRRATYRVRPDSPDELDLTLLARRQQVFRADVADVAAGGARVEFDEEDAPDLDLGARIDLAAHSRRHGFRKDIPARVVSSNKRGRRLAYGLCFEDRGVAEGDVCSVFNRREVLRSETDDASAPLAASVSGRGEATRSFSEWPATVRDISNAGISLGLDRRAHGELESCQRIDLALTLPGRDEPASIVCLIQYRAVDGDDVRYGCAYDWSETIDPLGTIEDIAGYLMEQSGGG
ncbi:MAG: PilZ domain-containing protein [Gammaproteobacteria bacterium]